MPTMLRTKKAQKLVDALIGKPEAYKGKRKLMSESEAGRKAEQGNQYRRTYGV